KVAGHEESEFKGITEINLPIEVIKAVLKDKKLLFRIFKTFFIMGPDGITAISIESAVVLSEA
ncbi:MAG: hypothetical protein PVI62_19895, partial [Desulfobacterales bacterium]